MKGALIGMAVLLALLLLAGIAGQSQSEQPGNYLECVTHGWPAEVCAGRIGYEQGRGDWRHPS